MKKVVRDDSMLVHRAAMSRQISSKRALLARLMAHDPALLPKSVKPNVLARAYHMLDQYEFVLRKKPEHRTRLAHRKEQYVVAAPKE